MRERILEELRAETPAAVLADIQVATIDAFCFGLLREFPLEAGVDPGFEIADETEMARFATEALDVTMRIARGVVVRDQNVRLLFTRIKAPVLAEVWRSCWTGASGAAGGGDIRETEGARQVARRCGACLCRTRPGRVRRTRRVSG